MIKRIAVQVNGKFIKNVDVPSGYDEKEYLFMILHKDKEVQKAIGKNPPARITHMPAKLINIITEQSRWF